MSSPLASYTATTAPTSSSKTSKIWQPTTNPIHFHPSVSTSSTSSSSGRIYTLSHTAFLLSYFVLRFNALVADPIRTMVEMAIPVVLGQAVWCCLCLPRSGHWEARVKGFKMDDTNAPAETKGTSSMGSGKGSVRRKGGVGISTSDKSNKADGISSRIVVSPVTFLGIESNR